MKEPIKNLYFAKCRHCIMDIINNYYENNEPVLPRPDYVDYYTIIKKDKNSKWVDLFNKTTKLVQGDSLSDNKTYYGEDIILSMEPLNNYLKDFVSLNKRECLIALELIQKISNFSTEYGYRYGSGQKSF